MHFGSLRSIAVQVDELAAICINVTAKPQNFAEERKMKEVGFVRVWGAFREWASGLIGTGEARTIERLGSSGPCDFLPLSAPRQILLLDASAPYEDKMRDKKKQADASLGNNYSVGGKYW